MSQMDSSASSPAVPIAALPPLGQVSAPAGLYALYSPQAVALATFLGAPVTGTAILALNYQRLSRPGAAIKAMLCGVLATVAMIGVGFVIPGQIAGFPLALAGIWIMRKVAQSLQGQAFEAHKLAGGKVASMWKAAGVGVLGLIIILGVVIAGVLATQHPAKHFAVGNSEILYSGSATEADARGLAKALTDDGCFDPSRATTVLLSKDASGTTLKFVINEEAAAKDNTLDLFTAVVEQVAPSVGGKPITLVLVSPTLTEYKRKTVQ